MSNKGVLIDMKHHSDWIVPRRVMCAFFWAGIILLFTGIILLVTSQHHGGNVYQAWGAVLLGLGFCLLLICFILCLHAYCVISVTEEEHERRRNIPPPPPYQHIVQNGRNQQSPPTPGELRQQVEGQYFSTLDNGGPGNSQNGRTIEPDNDYHETVVSRGHGLDRETSFTSTPRQSRFNEEEDSRVVVEREDPALRSNRYTPQRNGSATDPWLTQNGRPGSKSLERSRTEPHNAIAGTHNSRNRSKTEARDLEMANSDFKDLLTALSSSAAGTSDAPTSSATRCSPFPPSQATSTPIRSSSRSRSSPWYLGDSEDRTSPPISSPRTTFTNSPPRDNKVAHPRPSRQQSTQSEAKRLPKRLSTQATVYVANPDLEVADSKVTVYDNVHYVPYTQGSRTFCEI